MKLLSKEDAKDVDLTLQTEYQVSELVLMENAGTDVYLAIREFCKENFNNSKFLVFCGVGNNGGDGFVVARKLLQDTENVITFVVGDTSKFTPSTKANFEILSKITNKIYFIDSQSFKNSEDLYKFVKTFFSKNTVIVDALVGVGIKSRLKEPFLSVVNTINTLKNDGAYIFSVDVPSGMIISFDKEDILNSDPIIQADFTITFFSPKAGMFFPEMKKYLGKVIVSNLGFSRNLIDSIVPNNIHYLSEDTLIPYPQRDITSNKTSNGRVIIIGGSDKYFGASMMAARAASRTGVGYLISFVLEKFNIVMKTFAPDIVSVPVPSKDRGYFSEEDSYFIINSGVIKENDVIVIGNGLTTSEETKKFLKNILLNLGNIFVIDADGINILSEDIEFLKTLHKRDRLVLTPHIGEFSRLAKIDIQEIKLKPFSFGKKFVEEIGVNLVLKDNVNYIFFSDSEIWISDLNTPILARAGTGDVLAGLIGGNIAFYQDIKKGTILGIQMLGESSREWVNSKFYPTPLEVQNNKLRGL